MRRILGLDPGLRHTGWGIIMPVGHGLKAVAHGVIHPPQEGGLAHRLTFLYQALLHVIETHDPTEAAVEETFVNANARSTLKLGMARGVILLAPAMAGIPVTEYAANLVKKSVVGTGHADKDQVIKMIQILLNPIQGLTADSADALAVAVCHAHHPIPFCHPALDAGSINRPRIVLPGRQRGMPT